MTRVCLVLASAQVTDWPERIGLTLGVVALIGAVLGLMRWGWVRRGRRQIDIGPLPEAPQVPGASAGETAGSAVEVTALRPATWGRPARATGSTGSSCTGWGSLAPLRSR